MEAPKLLQLARRTNTRTRLFDSEVGDRLTIGTAHSAPSSTECKSRAHMALSRGVLVPIRCLRDTSAAKATTPMMTESSGREKFSKMHFSDLRTAPLVKHRICTLHYGTIVAITGLALKILDCPMVF